MITSLQIYLYSSRQPPQASRFCPVTFLALTALDRCFFIHAHPRLPSFHSKPLESDTSTAAGTESLPSRISRWVLASAVERHLTSTSPLSPERRTFPSSRKPVVTASCRDLAQEIQPRSQPPRQLQVLEWSLECSLYTALAYAHLQGLASHDAYEVACLRAASW